MWKAGLRQEQECMAVWSALYLFDLPEKKMCLVIEVNKMQYDAVHSLQMINNEMTDLAKVVFLCIVHFSASLFISFSG